jgi:SnoaL-like domain
MRQVDEAHWHDYFDTHNSRRFVDLVNNFYTTDATFENPKIQTKGREQLIAFLEQSNEFVRIKLIPHVIISNLGVTAIELDCVMHAEKDLPNFLLGPMKKGGEAKMRQAAIYHLAQDRISQARIYWGRQVK